MTETWKPADMVNPYIGTISHLLKSTVPEALVPFGYIRALPLVSGSSDFYCNEKIDGFPLGAASIMPGLNRDFENTFDHAREKCRCYANTLVLDKYAIRAEMTVTAHCHVYRFSGADRARITVNEGGSIIAEGKSLKITSPLLERGKPMPGKFEYAVLISNKDFKILSKEEDNLVLEIPKESAEFYAGVSYISFEKAALSLDKEIRSSGFDKARDEAFGIWNNYLGRFVIEGNTQDKRIAFYTAVYRVLRRMVDYGEHGNYYSGFCNKVLAGDHFYAVDPLWDTFRCAHPLRMLFTKDEEEGMLQSYVDIYEQSGCLPSFMGRFSESPTMIGFHGAALFADAYAKGLKADYEKAYQGIRANALEQTMTPWNCQTSATVLDRCYYEKGFFPALKKGEKETVPNVNVFERRQAVSVTLEHAFDDWCAASLARALGKEEDYNLFLKRSANWKNLYNPKLGLFVPKDIDGNWIEDFDPMLAGGQGGRDYYTENNAYTWQWSVPHDYKGLFDAMGGTEEAEKKLDALFTMGCGHTSKYMYMAQFPDSTGLMGQFCMGNEPSFNIPYIYDYIGVPWKTQKRVRDCMDIWFLNSPIGICGDEDQGAMSAWFIFSALGFYPVCSGTGVYAIGTPLFDSAAISLGEGKTFTVKSPGAGDGKRYIQLAALNGKPLPDPFLTHKQIAAGGELTLVMGEAPKKKWA